MAKTSGELYKESQDAFAKAKADRDKGLADAGDDEARQAEVTESYNRALGDATKLAKQFEAQRDAEEKEASHQRAAEISNREKLLESLAKPATQRQLDETAPESKRSSGYQAPGWERGMPAMLQSSDVLKRSGTDAQDEAEAQLQALDAWMSTVSEGEFENVYGPEVRSALGDIKAPPMDPDDGTPVNGVDPYTRAASDFHVPYTDADGGVYLPDTVIAAPTTAEVPRALAVLNAVTRVNAPTAKGAFRPDERRGRDRAVIRRDPAGEQPG